MRRRIGLSHTLILVACLALGASGEGAAQGLNEASSRDPHKLDEFGRVGGCDYGARLDNLALMLQNEPSLDGYIITYGPGGEGSGTGYYAMRVAKQYMVSTRGLDEERIKTIYAGRYKEWNEVLTQLWIAPHDGAPPEPVRYDTRLEAFTGKFCEFDAWDTFLTDEGGTGPTHGNVLRASLADVMHQQADTRVFIVVYNRKGALPGAWRRISGDIASSFENGYKVEAERIKIIYAGYRAETRKKEEGRDTPAFVQLWLLPKDARPPVAEVKEPEETPVGAERLGSYSADQMADKDEARRAFENFADVLKHDEKLNACLIVRPADNSEREPEAEQTPEPDDATDETSKPPESTEADLMALVEKWRADLVKDYGISEHRLIVTTGPAEEWSHGDVETWIVPAGAALPDPNVKEEMDAVGETSEAGEMIAVEEATPKEF